MMKVLVTGAAGFVGSRLSRALLERGDSVVGLDNFVDYYPRALKERHLVDLREFPGFQLVEGDFRDEALVSGLFAQHGFTALAHIGAMAAVRYSAEHPLIYGEVNVQGSLNLLNAARLHGKPRCVLASTGSVYGRDTPVPFMESAPAAMPLAPYPASKRAMEMFAHSFAHLYQLPTTVLRFFNVYGPHGRPDMMPWQWSLNLAAGKPLTLFNGGHLKRDWTYVDDIVRGFVSALDRGLEWDILNLGCGRPIENLDFVKILEQLVGREAIIVDQPVPVSEPLETYANIARAGEVLGWQPRVNVEEGLANFVTWLREEGHLPA